MAVAYHGKLWINSANAGWSEGFYLNVGSTREGAVRMAEYTSLRSAITPGWCNLVYAMCSTLESVATGVRRKPDGLPARMPFPLEGQWKDEGAGQGSINIAADALHVRFVSTHEGRTAHRLFRGISDGEVRNERFLGLVQGMTIEKAGIGAAPVPPLFPQTYLGGVENLIKWILINTKHGYYATPGNKTTLTLADWEMAIIIRPTQRNVGRPFGPFRGRRRRPAAS